ncbi:uncharacterized protein BX663DRAFT_488971 [Cokeromyces recurvatus]|uniref:uncharacterized protein n=1 Tax=Cokeromyces recurvatus TaxID=90255 RepID=UPI00221EFD89|nr:uncharacterized protein BX663DRAFT_488971 [Cokeromyces recurvatus]KAI7899743.1 hypothetical protein BX663DRAFT_488971 [Cokeromyces recurvatus]
MMGDISSVITLKTSVSGIQWRHELIPRLKDLVSTVNILVTHTFALTKFIFINELERIEFFDLEKHAEKDFYVEVFLELTKQNRKPSKSTKTKDYRDLIRKYKNEYCILTKYDPIELKYAQQIAAYECAKIDTAYKNSVILQFGNRFRMFINHLTQQKAKITKRKQELKKSKKSENDIKKIISDEITKPLTQLKLSLASGNTQSMPVTLLDDKGVKLLKEFFGTYGPRCEFMKASIYYDCKTQPLKHLKAYYKTAKYCEELGYKSFMCFPLRRTYVPCYMTIDTLIVNNHILRNTNRSNLDKGFIWSQIVNHSSKGMKDQGASKSLKFRGMIQSDGVGVSVLKQNKESTKGGTRGTRLEEDDNFRYIHLLSKTELEETTGRCVLIDPGRRDMLYCMQENSESGKDKHTYRYTSNQCAVETKKRKFTKLRDIKKNYVTSAIKVDKFSDYLKARSIVEDPLREYYSNENIPHKNANLLPFRKRCYSHPWGLECRKYKVPRANSWERHEHKTSSLCPTCKVSKLETFKKVQNPRPFRRSKYHKVECHGLLRCLNHQCLESLRLWNRDLAAVLNFRDILKSHREGLGRPTRFKRQSLKRPLRNNQQASSRKLFRHMPSNEGRESA